MTEQGFWDDVEKAQGVMQKSKALDDKIEGFKSMEDEFEEVEILFELSQEDQSMEKELKSKIEEVYKLSLIHI